ncbi:MAG: hypothetical protein IKK39_16245, partial [Thermoguttaceae bacterium]|nr:hypothetical protein [Thermoguttaceae bacterium]
MSPTSAPLSVSTSPTSADSRRRFVSFPVAARFAFFLFFVWFWGVRYGDFLYVAQGCDLFLWRWSFLTDAIRPAELSLRLSAFFVQFFYYPALGAAILAGFLSFIQFGTERLFRLTGRLFPLSFVPSALVALQITEVGYYIFEYFDVAFLFSFVFQYSFVLLFALIFDALRSERARTAFLTLGVAACFPIFGVFALLAAALCLLKEATRPDDATQTAKTVKTAKAVKINAKRRKRLAFLALWTLAVPPLYWPLFSGTARSLGALYVAGLTEETVSQRDTATDQIYAAYLGAILAFFVAVAVLDALRRTVERRSPKALQPEQSKQPKQPEQPERPLKPTPTRRSSQKSKRAAKAQTPETSPTAPTARPALSLDSTATIS